MCGIAGFSNAQAPAGGKLETLARMAATLRHRGPDGYGFYVGERVGLAHTRLSIIDPAGGAQPLTNEDGTVVIVYNGEVYNYLELRRELERSHDFRTASDTEVIVHAYEEWGEAMVERLNGQFAFALYDRGRDRLLLARDRFGIRPLFYSLLDGGIAFASEVKALFASRLVEPRPDPEGLDEVFTFWAALPPRSVFLGVRSLEPGSMAVWAHGHLTVRRYYSLGYPRAGEPARRDTTPLGDFLESSVALRMRADVPVGAYLSGGLDSSVTSTLAAARSPHQLRTFSVAFEDGALDESAFQQLVAAELGSRHNVRAIGAGSIAAVFPDVVRHAETPLVRTAPAPLYLLSRLTRERGIKVVLTGEGADEAFLGYDLFKETRVRLFCARSPDSRWRPRLFDRLYPYLSHRGGEFWRNFFLSSGADDDPLFSHLPRFLLTSRIKDFYGPAMRAHVRDGQALQRLRDSLPADFQRWSPLHRAAFLEVTTLLGPYLLSSQGDRMALAHGVEGRFPFLDHQLFEFASALDENTKLRGLREKDALRRWALGRIPPAVERRPKQPYRAPDSTSFLGAAEPEYVTELLSSGAVRSVGLFDDRRVAGLLRRARARRPLGFRENQALVALLSTQIWHRTFMTDAPRVRPLDPKGADVLLREPALQPA